MGVIRKALQALKDLQAAISLLPASGVLLWNGRTADIHDILWQLAWFAIPLGIWFGGVKPWMEASAIRRDRASEKREREWQLIRQAFLRVRDVKSFYRDPRSTGTLLEHHRLQDAVDFAIPVLDGRGIDHPGAIWGKVEEDVLEAWYNVLRAVQRETP